MFNTFRLRMLLTAGWVLVVAALWWGYGTLARRYDLNPAVDGLDAAVAAGDWDGAGQAARALHARWQVARPIVELNHGGMLLEDFELDLSRMLGGLRARDEATVRAELSGLRTQWNGLQSSFPDGK